MCLDRADLILAASVCQVVVVDKHGGELVEAHEMETADTYAQQPVAEPYSSHGHHNIQYTMWELAWPLYHTMMKNYKCENMCCYTPNWDRIIVRRQIDSEPEF